MKEVHFDAKVDRFDDWERIATAAHSIDPTGRDWGDLTSVSFNEALDYAFHLGMMETLCDMSVRMFVKEGKLKVQAQVFTDEIKTFVTRDIPIEYFSIETDKCMEYIEDDVEHSEDEDTITVKFTID